MRNIELKARCRDLAAARAAALSLGAVPQWTRRQIDAFFLGARARLKLRQEEAVAGSGGAPATAEGRRDAAAGPDAAPRRAELIVYRRADAPGPRPSEYDLVALDDGPGAERVLAVALGVASRVAKTRSLLLAGPSRIHLDEVDGLGTFVEIERVLADGEPEEVAAGDVARIAAALGVAEEDLVPVAYADLLAAGRTRPDSAPGARSGDARGVPERIAPAALP